MCVIVGTFVLVATAPPSAPQNLHVDSTGRDHFTLSWDTPKETGGGPVKHYIIEMYSLDDPEFIEKFQVDGSVTSYTASGLQQNGSGYMLSVVAENDMGVSETAAELDSPVLAGVCLTLVSYYVKKNPGCAHEWRKF